MAHIGLIKALEEEGIRPSVISGASAGALVGALYAQGHPLPDILEFFKTTPIFHWRFYSSQKPGLLDTEKYRLKFSQYFPANDFSALQKNLYVAATDIAAAENVFFSQGPLIKVLLASSAVPVIFSPVEIEGTLYADGGIMNNFPVEPLVGSCDIIIGSHTNPIQPMSKQNFTSSYKVLRRATQLRLHANSQTKFTHCNYVFGPEELSSYNLLDSRYIEQTFEIGYKTAKKEMKKILRSLNRQPLDNETLPPNSPK